MSPDPTPTSHPRPEAAGPALVLADVSVVRDGRTVVAGVDWEIARDQRWVLLGANGSGKTTLVRIAALYDHPSSGTLDVLGERLGRCDVRSLRRRIGYVSPGFVDMVRPELVVSDVVMCALNAALEPWWHRYDDADRRRARDALDRVGIGWLAERRFGTLSSGERQRVQLARALMCDPELLLLDEPTAGLDLAGREELVGDLDALAASGHAPAMVLVTHHVEEIPTSFDHALLLGERGAPTSRVVASGPIDAALTSASLSVCFGLALDVERRGGRWTARSV